MEFLIVILLLGGTIGLFLILFFYLDGLIMVEPLEKLEYIAQMGVVFAPYAVMSTEEFGEPYTLQTWAITIGLMLGCLLLTLFIRISIDWIEGHADRRQIKKQKTQKQKAVKNLLGRSAIKRFKDNEIIEKSENNNQKAEKRQIGATFAMYLAKAKGSTLVSAIIAPIIIVLNGGFDKLFEPLCICTVFLGVGLSLLCGWLSKKILLQILAKTTNQIKGL